jgi:hypothetical protein
MELISYIMYHLLHISSHKTKSYILYVYQNNFVTFLHLFSASLLTSRPEVDRLNASIRIVVGTPHIEFTHT